MRYISLIFIALGLIFVSQESLGNTTGTTPEAIQAQRCSTLQSELNEQYDIVTKSCADAGIQDLNSCGQQSSDCESLTFNEDECIEASTLNRETCRSIVRTQESGSTDPDLFENNKCAELASQSMDGIRDQLNDTQDELTQARSELADANSSSANNANGLMDAMKSIQEAQNQANQQKMQAAQQRDEQIAQAQDQRRRALDAADEADLEIMKQQAEIRAKAAENAIKMSSEIASLKIDCLTKAEEKLAAERAVRNNAALGRSLKEKSLGSMIGGNKRFEDRYNTYKNDCMSSEITSEKAKTLEIANNAAIVAAEEQMMITQQAKEKAMRRLAGEELMAAEAMQRAQVTYDMAVQQADMTASQARTQGMIGALQGMVQPGGGVPGVGGNSSGSPQMQAAQNNVADLTRERQILRCKQRCGALLGGRDRSSGSGGDIESAQDHLNAARAAANSYNRRCDQAAANCTGANAINCSKFTQFNTASRSPSGTGRTEN